MNTELCLLWVPRLRRYHGCGCLVWGENFLDAGASHLGVSRSNVFYWGGGVLFVYLRVPIAYHVFFAPGAPIAYHVFFAPAAPNDLRALVVKSTVRAKVNGVTLK